MTDPGRRISAVAVAVVVFLVSWAAVAARPWAAAGPDPRLAALAVRERHLRAEARLVQQIVDLRLSAQRAALAARRSRGAQAPSHAPQAPRAAAVRVVTLPPLTITRSS